MLILFGLFQKCVIADNCALIANAVLQWQLRYSNGASRFIGNLCLRLADLRRLCRLQ